MIRLLLALLAAVLAPGVGPAAAATCYDDWSVAAPIAREQKLVSVEALAPLVRSMLGAEIATVKLCEEGGRYVYRLVLRGPKGELRSTTVDARNPF